VPYINQAGGGGTGAISGVTVTGTAAAGDAIIATSSSAGSWVFPPDHEFGYDQITSFVAIASTTEATGTTIISCAAHVFDGSPVLATFFAPGIQMSAVNQELITVSLFEGATQIARLCQVEGITSATLQGIWPGIGMLRFTPSAASHTYTVSAISSSLTATPGIIAGANGTGAYPPAFIRFTKV
jgi:hypothetical protein